MEQTDPFYRAIYGVTYAELLGLLQFLDDPKVEAAIEYDLIRLGLRLRDVGTPEFSWRDLLVVVQQSPQDSALYRAMNRDDHQWGLPELLLAEAVDALNVANWQRGSGKKRDYPKPIPRPGVEPDSKTYGKEALPIDDMAAWLGWTK